MIEFGRGAAHELDRLAKLGRRGLADGARELGARQPANLPDVRQPAAVAVLIEMSAVVAQIVDAAKLASHADRPRERRAGDVEHGLDVVQQLDRRTAVAIELVDEADDRRRAQSTDFHELDRPRLDALRGIDDHERAVDRCQRAIRVLGEILVTRRVEQIDQRVAVRKLHDGRRDRDAALLLEAHPIRRRVPGRFAALDGTRHLDRAAEQQQLLGQRGLARVGVRNDRERSPFQVLVHGEALRKSARGVLQSRGQDHGVFAAILGLVVSRANADLLEPDGGVQTQRDRVRRPHLEKHLVGARVGSLSASRRSTGAGHSPNAARSGARKDSRDAPRRRRPT